MKNKVKPGPRTRLRSSTERFASTQYGMLGSWDVCCSVHDAHRFSRHDCAFASVWTCRWDAITRRPWLLRHSPSMLLWKLHPNFDARRASAVHWTDVMDFSLYLMWISVRTPTPSPNSVYDMMYARHPVLAEGLTGPKGHLKSLFRPSGRSTCISDYYVGKLMTCRECSSL